MPRYDSASVRSGVAISARPARSAIVRATDGRELGQHRGLHFYTLGQRKGIGVPSNTDHEAYVVVGKRAADRAIDDAHMRADLAAAFERAFVPPGIDAARHHDRAFDRLDDVGEADFGRVAGEAETAAGAPRAFDQAGGRQLAHQLLHRRQRQPGLAGQRGRIEPAHAAAMPRGGGHHHDGIVGKAG